MASRELWPFGGIPIPWTKHLVQGISHFDQVVLQLRAVVAAAHSKLLPIDTRLCVCGSCGEFGIEGWRAP